MATPVNGNAPKARNVPERADTGAVDPSDYTPTSKAAPEPAIEAPGIVAADASTEAPLPEISDTQRKPYQKKAPIATAVNAVKSTVDTAKKAVDTVRNVVNPPNQPKLTDKALVAAISAKDSQRSKAVKRYRRETRSLINPLIRAVFIQEGIQGVSSEAIDAVWEALQGVKTVAGYRVTKRGDIKLREVAITDVFAYTFGSTALDVELWGARQWINHPTAFDIAVIAGAGLSAYQAMSLEDSPIRKAVSEIVKSHVAKNSEEPIKAEAKVSDPT